MESKLNFEELLKTIREMKYAINGMISRIELLESRSKEYIDMENFSNISKECKEKNEKYIMEDLEDPLVDAIFDAESIYKIARNLFFFVEDCIDFNTKKGFDKEEIINSNITFEVINDDILHFTLPEILRVKGMKSRKTNNMTDEVYRHIMREKINEVLDDMFENEKRLEIFDKHTLVFIHHYNKNSEKDMDNLSLKKFIDALSERLVVDDSMAYNNIIQLSEKDENAYTELYVIRGQELKKNILKFIAEKS